MAVVHCALLREGQQISVDAQGKRTYTHMYRIKADTPNMGLLSLLLGAHNITPATGIDPLPAHQSEYNINGDSDFGAILQDVTLKHFGEQDNLYFYEIQAVWKAPPKGQEGPLPENPLDWPPKYSAETNKFTRKATRDVVDDRLIANSAGDLFEDMEVDDGREILTIVKNEWPLQAIIQRMQYYKNAVNLDPFLGAPPYAAKIDSITMGEISSVNDVYYYPMTYRVEFAKEGEDWRITADNRGTHCWDFPSTHPLAVKQRVIVLTGERKGEPRDWAYLAYDGTQLPDGEDPLEIPSPDDPVNPGEGWLVNTPRLFAPLGLV